MTTHLTKFRRKPWRIGTGPAIRIGYVPMIDCAPLIAAEALGLFEKYGLNVELHRLAGWATVREKLLHGELEGAHAHASMAYAIHCGIGTIARPCLTGMVLSLNGSAITLGNDIARTGVRDAASFGALVKSRRDRRLTLATVLDLSSQRFVLSRWLASGGIDPARDVNLVVLPSPLVHENLMDGYIDGYCVGEPWSSVLLVERKAWCVAVSRDVCPGHPEKVLLVLQEFAEGNEMEHLALIAACLEAAAYCQERRNRRDLARILARPEYLGLPVGVLENCLVGPFFTGIEEREIPDLVVYAGGGANVPGRDKARWVFDEIEAHAAPGNTPGFRRDAMRKVFREDIFWRAAALAESVTPGLVARPSGPPRRMPARADLVPA